ncbi:cysteine and tyrosine-rich protein 1-like [Pomacea canaliculata]|uniref:cysteine and tyrosine-rich protein 1-like n=1 Tax=Pomacea canaliculata TaxID=400727 RepID=UPI000D738AD7|nr:cysteine and tyrosine-rich protein 1-like [Pomacea canaliculata]
MAADALCILAVVSVPLALLAGVEGDICYSQTDFEICKYGCCGINQSYCCDLNVGGIVGGVIGGLLLIVIIVTVACCLAKKQAYRGRVIGAATIAATSNVTVVQTTTTSGVQQYPGMYSYGPFGGSAPPPPPSLQPLPSYYSSSSQGIAAPAMPAYAFPPTYSTAPGYTPFVKAPNY